MSHIVVITTLSHPLEVTEKCPYKENQWILLITMDIKEGNQNPTFSKLYTRLRVGQIMMFFGVRNNRS